MAHNILSTAALFAAGPDAFPLSPDLPQADTGGADLRTERIQTMLTDLETRQQHLKHHPVYSASADIKHVRTFMEHHVFAVWDFMSLLKVLQGKLSTMSTPWVPAEDSLAARLINEITVNEETQEVTPGVYMSHFELYLKAMDQLGANSAPIRCVVRMVRQGAAKTLTDLQDSMEVCQAPLEARKFVTTTMELSEAPVHSAAAVFLFSRESLIPLMFRTILEELGDKAELYKRYLEVHIEIDEEEHGPMAMRIVKRLCGDNETKWNEAHRDAKRAIKARNDLWDAIYEKFTATTDEAERHSERRCTMAEDPPRPPTHHQQFLGGADAADGPAGAPNSGATFLMMTLAAAIYAGLR